MNFWVHLFFRDVFSGPLGSNWSLLIKSVHSFLFNITISSLVELESFWIRSIWDECLLASLPVKGLGVWISEPMNVLINAFFGDIILLALGELESFWVGSIWDKCLLGSFPVKSFSVWVRKPMNVLIDTFF